MEGSIKSLLMFFVDTCTGIIRAAVATAAIVDCPAVFLYYGLIVSV